MKKQAKASEKAPRNICYLRVSSEGQDNEKNKADVLMFANEKNFGYVEFVEEKITGKKPWKERLVGKIIADLQAGDRLILPEISRLGRSMLDIMSCLSAAKEKEISIYDIKNGYELNGKFQGELMAIIFSICAQIERDLISSRTIEGLKAAKAAGKILGRPRGPGKSKLDQYRPEIIALLENRSTKSYVAQRYGCSAPTLLNWLAKNKIPKPKEVAKGEQS